MSKTIFVIEPDINFSLSLNAKLGLLDHRIVSHASYLHNNIILSLKDHDPDMVLIELGDNPNYSLELVHKIKTEKLEPSFKVIIYTDRYSNVLEERSLLYGADYVYDKNILSIDELVNRIHRILSHA